MNKSGQGHIEMILSFALFIGAIVFIFIYINPFSQTVDNSDEISIVQDIIIRNISAEVGRLSVVSDNGGCYDIDYTDYPNTNHVEVIENSPVPLKTQYIIYFGSADVFENDIQTNYQPGCPSVYQTGVFSNISIISYRKLKRVFDSTLDYKEVKKNLGINLDFSVSFYNFDRTPFTDFNIGVSKTAPQGVEVEARELPLVTINESGHINPIIINLKVWR